MRVGKAALVAGKADDGCGPYGSDEPGNYESKIHVDESMVMRTRETDGDESKYRVKSIEKKISNRQSQK